MPLHLLGKKSWNVYNADNIARVKKDEAEHAAREAADEQRMQEADAERRLKLLRGIPVSPPQSPSHQHSDETSKQEIPDKLGRPKKRRRLHDEDDTEMELRYAQEDLSARVSGKDLQLVGFKKSSEAPLTDLKGNINLFPVEAPRKGQNNKNAEVEAEKKRKEKELEDQYTMRFSNAAGFKQSVGEKPWYQTLGQPTPEKEEEVMGKDVWGNEDPGRKEREKRRVVSEDPLAMIQRGVEGVRKVERERRTWVEEKRRDIREMDEEERRRERKRRKEREGRRHRHRHRSGSGHRRGERGGSRDVREHSGRHHHRDRKRNRDD